MRPVVFYGAGEKALWLLQIYRRYGIVPVCFADRDPGKQGTKIEGIAVLAPEDVKALYRDFAVVITPVSPLKEQIRKELLESGFASEEAIINSVEDLHVMYKSLCSAFLLISCFSDAKVFAETPTSRGLAKRIARAYRRQYAGNGGDGMWGFMNGMKTDVHQALLADDADKLCGMLSNPLTTDLMYGFDQLCKNRAQINQARSPLNMRALLYRLGEIWGAVPVINTEFFNDAHGTTGFTINYDAFLSCIDTDAILTRLNGIFCCDIAFPNPYLGESGLEVQTSRGKRIASYRALQALHQAFIIWEKLGHKAGRVLEIGAGLGRTAYYCKALFGIDYTIIDLPMTQVAAAHFLAQSLGEEMICLCGEAHRPGQIQILPPPSQEGDFAKVDLVVNFDSLTEMDYATMKGYWEKIKKSAPAFLSVNHEINEHTVRELVSGDPDVKTYSRGLYGMRAGYAEEYVTFG